MYLRSDTTKQVKREHNQVGCVLTNMTPTRRNTTEKRRLILQAVAMAVLADYTREPSPTTAFLRDTEEDQSFLFATYEKRKGKTGPFGTLQQNDIR